jgi:hypothetical protein
MRAVALLSACNSVCMRQSAETLVKNMHSISSCAYGNRRAGPIPF